MEQKRCNQCTIILIEENVAKKNKTQWRGICKKCRSKNVTHYNRENSEAHKVRQKRHNRKKGIGCLYPCMICRVPLKRKGFPHLCSDRCRFFYYLQSPNECWVWKGCRSSQQYGRLCIGGRNKIASRLAYEIFKGPIPKGKIVCHICDNPYCVNPAHLWIGTHQDNMRDIVKKGRARNRYTRKNI